MEFTEQEILQIFYNYQQKSKYAFLGSLSAFLILGKTLDQAIESLGDSLCEETEEAESLLDYATYTQNYSMS